MQSFGNNFIPVIPYEDDIIYTIETPFCWDNTCGCHEDPELIAEVAHQLEDGLLTPEEATYTIQGKVI